MPDPDSTAARVQPPDCVPDAFRSALAVPAVALCQGEVLFEEGDLADHFFVVEAGTFEVVRVRSGRVTPVSTFGPGEFGGEVPLLSGSPHLATGRAATDVTLRVLGADAFWGMIARSRQARDRVLDNMSVRLGELHRTSLEVEILLALSRVTSGVAHELLNPLNLAVGFAEMAAERIGGPGHAPTPDALDEVRGNLALVCTHSQRAVATVRRMRTYVRALQASRGHVDVAALVGEVAASTSPGGVRLVVEVEPDLPAVEAARSALADVLRGLLDNALHAVRARGADAGRAPGQVRIRAGRLARHVEIEVSDNGVGVSPEHVGRVFEPFYTTHAGADGSGLGLAIAYDVVTAAHGGSVEFESTEGEGTTVTLRLPTPHVRADAAR